MVRTKDILQKTDYYLSVDELIMMTIKIRLVSKQKADAGKATRATKLTYTLSK